MMEVFLFLGFEVFAAIWTVLELFFFLLGISELCISLQPVDA